MALLVIEKIVKISDLLLGKQVKAAVTLLEYNFGLWLHKFNICVTVCRGF